MQWRRTGTTTVLAVVTILACVCVPCKPAAAHGAALTAYLTVVPGQAQTTSLLIHVVDAYSSSIMPSVLRVNLSDTHSGAHSSASAKLNPNGSMTAPLDYTAGPAPMVTITARLPDGDWSGQLQLTLDPNPVSRTEWGVLLRHQDAAAAAAPAAPSWPPWAGVAGVPALWLLPRRRRPRSAD